MEIYVFRNIGGIIESSLVEPAQQIAESLSGNLIPFVAIGITIWVMVYALAIVRGVVHTPVSDFVWRIVKITLILYPGIAGGIFQPEAFGFYTEISNAIYNAVNQGGGGVCAISENDPMGIYSALDCGVNQSLTPLFEVAGKVLALVAPADAGSLDIAGNILSAIVPFALFLLMFAGGVILAIAMVAYMGFEVISLRVTVGLAFALSPLFIFALAFEPIKSFFSNWLNFVIKSIVFQALFVTFMGVAFGACANLVGQMFDFALTDIIGALFAGAFALVSFIIMMVIFVFVAARLPSVASELTGGGAGSAGLGTILTAQAGKQLFKWTGGKLGSMMNKPGGKMTGND
ncbi:type IV secretion system protein [Propionivibrio sp.]|uniref:type IV secretion system protein n=1 Tax=Propionivibrio sp. TaxID=2212460 RepID=UPI0039E5D5BF